MSQRYIVVTPVFDDWVSFSQLIANIDQKCAAKDIAIEVIAVDDGSPSVLDSSLLPLLDDRSCIEKVSVIRLALNLGHQRAIAVGLVSLLEYQDVSGIIVMDSDGEDRPDDLADLIAMSQAHPNDIILARRAKRSEGPLFSASYLLYRMLFRVLTGQNISFGNFCLLPAHAVRRLVHMSELWNNLPATIIRSRLPYRSLATARGRRYAGRSKMNVAALVTHGLSSVSIYTDAVFVRVLLATSLVCLVSVLGLIGVAIIRFGTSLAIPGWATTVAGDLLIMLTQALILMTATTLMLLSSRSTRQFIPISDARQFIVEQCVVAQGQRSHALGAVL